MIIVSGGFLPWPYMLPVEGILDRIRPLLEADVVRFPTSQELELLQSKDMLHDVQNADAYPRPMATESP